MRRGLDVADIEERTKIRAKYLRALEHEEWDQLPGPTFVRTFLRTYAEVVGLDPALLIEEYRVSHEPEPELAPLAGSPAAMGRERRRPPGPPPRAAIAAVLVIAFVGFLLVLGLSADKPGGGSRTTDTTPAAEPPRPNRRPAAARGVTVRIAPQEPTYVCVDTGEQNEVLFEGTLGATRTFRDPRRLRLNLGKRAVRVSANGEPFTIEDSPEPLGLEIDRSGATEIVDGLRPCA